MKMTMLHTSVKARILLVLGLLVLVQVIYAISYLKSSQETHIENDGRQRLAQTLLRLSGTLEYLFSENKLMQVREEITALDTEPEISAAFLVRGDNTIFASLGQQHIGDSLDLVVRDWRTDDSARLKLLINDGAAENAWIAGSGTAVIGVLPVFMGEAAVSPGGSGQGGGFLVLKYSLTETKNEAINKVYQQCIWQILLMVMAAVVVYTQFSRGVQRSEKSVDSVGDSLLKASLMAGGNEDFTEFGVAATSQRYRAGKEKIQRHLKHMEAILNATAEGIIGFDADGVCVFANRAAHKILRLGPGTDLEGLAVADIFQLAEGGGHGSPWLAFQAQCSTDCRYQLCVYTRAHVQIDLEINCYPMGDDRGSAGLVASFLDVTERKIMAGHLMVKNYAIDASINGIMFTDLDGKINYINKAFTLMWALEQPDRVLGEDAFIFLGPQGLDRSLISVVKSQGYWRGKVVTALEAGGYLHVQLLVSLIKDENDTPILLMFSFMDISEMVHVQEALRQSKETYAKAEAIAHIGSWDWEISTGELRWTDEIYRIFGQEPQSFGATYDAFLETIHPDDRQHVVDAVGAAVADPQVAYAIEHRIIRSRTKEERTVQERGKVYRDSDGRPIRMIGTVYDITEQKQVQKALYEERNFVSAILESVGALVVVYDRFGVIRKFNRACERTTGFAAGEIIGRYVWDHLIVDAQMDAERSKFKAMTADAMISEYENYWITRKGDQRLLAWSNTVLKSPDGEVEHVIAVGRDITESELAARELARHRGHLEEMVAERTEELRQTQSQLMKKERLATLGQLTATVSHELRNPLGAMKAALFVVSKKLSIEDQRLNEAVSRLQRNVDRCDHIIDELLDFTRITELELRHTLLQHWLDSAIQDVRVPEKVTLERDYQCPDLVVRVDVDRLRRAIINVVENAYQAALENTKNARHQLVITVRREGDRVLLQIKDNGVGMAKEVQARIFEPLYSTKGFGVGLGMPTVKQIMDQHAGGIEVESEPGQGSTVTLWLPGNCIVGNDIGISSDAKFR